MPVGGETHQDGHVVRGLSLVRRFEELRHLWKKGDLRLDRRAESLLKAASYYGFGQAPTVTPRTNRLQSSSRSADPAAVGVKRDGHGGRARGGKPGAALARPYYQPLVWQPVNSDREANAKDDKLSEKDAEALIQRLNKERYAGLIDDEELAAAVADINARVRRGRTDYLGPAPEPPRRWAPQAPRSGEKLSDRRKQSEQVSLLADLEENGRDGNAPHKAHERKEPGISSLAGASGAGHRPQTSQEDRGGGRRSRHDRESQAERSREAWSL